VPRARGQVRAAADRKPGGYRGFDEGGHLGARQGAITPGEAGRIAAVVDTFVRAIETREFELRLQELEGAGRDAGDGRRIELSLQPVSVILLLICCK
jgi:hypothetical protein